MYRFGGSVGLLIADLWTATCGPSSGCASVRESPPHQRSAHEEDRLPCSADVSSRRICAALRSRSASHHCASCSAIGSGAPAAIPPSSVGRRLLGMACGQASLDRGTLDLAAGTWVCLAASVVGEQGRRLVFLRRLLAARRCAGSGRGVPAPSSALPRGDP